MNPQNLSEVKTNVLSGLTVALALVPEAIAFALVAHVHPLVGLYAAFMVGLITSLIGGRPGMISGATGALAVVMVALVVQHGVEYLFATVVLMGVLQIAFGLLKFGKFIRMVPHPVMLGFVNGLAIVIFLAQMGHFKVRRCRRQAGLDAGRTAVHHAGTDRTDHGHHLSAATTDQSHSLHARGYRRGLRAGDLQRTGHQNGRRYGFHQGWPAPVPPARHSTELGDALYHLSLQPDPRGHRPDRVAADAEPDRRHDADPRHA